MTVIATTRSAFGERFAMILAVCIAMIVGSAAQGTSPSSQKLNPVVREAARGPVKFVVRIEHDETTTPEPVSLTVRVEAEKGVEVMWPIDGETLGDFLITKMEELPAREDDLTRTQERVYSLMPVYAGRAVIPGLTVRFTDRREKADSSSEVVEGEATTEPIVVTVHQNLADVRGPLSLPTAWSARILLWIIGLILLIGLIALTVWRWRIRRRKAEMVAARPVPAHEWALAELDMLEAQGLIERGRVQEFYYRINAILRGYMERRWGLMASEQTSEEFVRDLQSSSLLNHDQKVVLRQFIDACDPVKYARQQPTDEEIQWVGRTAREFVISTAQQPAEPPLAEAA